MVMAAIKSKIPSARLLGQAGLLAIIEQGTFPIRPNIRLFAGEYVFDKQPQRYQILPNARQYWSFA